MTDNNLHEKLNWRWINYGPRQRPVKVFLIKYQLVRDKILSRKGLVFNCLRNSNVNFRSSTLVINISWENKVLTSRPCQTARHQHLLCQLYLVFVFVYIARIYILFLQMKKELVLTTNHGLLASYITRKVCFLTTNHGHLPSYISENLFSDHISWPFAKPHNSQNLFSDHKSWPFAVAESQNIHSLWRKLSYLFSKASRSKSQR